MIGEKGDGGFVDHGPFEKGVEGQNAEALTTAATRGCARPGRCGAVIRGARPSYSTSVRTTFTSLQLLFAKHSYRSSCIQIHSSSLSRPFRILQSHRHGLLYHIRNSRLAPQFPRFYATSLILFPCRVHRSFGRI